MSRIEQLSHLKRRRPHRSPSTGDRSRSLPVVEHLRNDECSSQTQQPQPHSSNLDEPRRGLVKDSEVFDDILSGPKLLNDSDVLASSVYGEGGDLGKRREERAVGVELGEQVGKAEVLTLSLSFPFRS